jgi:hypothetical protein
VFIRSAEDHLDLIFMIAHVDIVKKEARITILITWYSKVGDEFLVARRSKHWRLPGAQLRISQECLDHPANHVEFLIDLLVDCLDIKFELWRCDVSFRLSTGYPDENMKVVIGRWLGP